MKRKTHVNKDIGVREAEKEGRKIEEKRKREKREEGRKKGREEIKREGETVRKNRWVEEERDSGRGRVIEKEE